MLSDKPERNADMTCHPNEFGATFCRCG